MTFSPTTGCILVVDDEPMELRLLTHQLSTLGCTQIVQCGSGEEALGQIAAAAPPVELIILDINMPGLDGIECLRRLAAIGYRGGIVLISGESGRVLESVTKLTSTLRLKTVGNLRKPVKARALLSLLEEFAAREDPSRSCLQTAPKYQPAELREAITGGQLVNFYQPQVDFSTRALTGMECLVRWQHPTHGLVAPNDFIEPAAECGLLPLLTRTVLRAAMIRAKLWRQQGQNVSIAVNISMDDLADLSFPDFAADLAREQGISPHLITLEVTEGQVMRHMSTVLDVLGRLCLKRFHLSIDDFGTGHSSLAQLRDLPFEELKIDRGFVHGAAGSSTLRAICDATIRMGKKLKMRVVAEGVEEAADWNLLHSLGCHVAQGYLIGRPMPGEEIDVWMKGWVDQNAAQVSGQAG